MPFSTRSLSPGSGSPASKRRRILSEDEFSYPTLPANCVNHDFGDFLPAGSFEMSLPMEHIPRTTSVEWGGPVTAAKRALIEPRVTSANKQLFRTYHPSLSHCEVWLALENDDKRIWIVATNFDPPESLSTHAGGLEVHLHPGRLTYPTTAFFGGLDDPLGPLTPRKFLSQTNLKCLRHMFPMSIGARVLISGFIIILFKSRADIEKSWIENGQADSFGHLRLRYDILEDSPTQQTVLRGAAITAAPDCSGPHASLGLKLRFPDNLEAITVPTHAFVALQRIHGPIGRRMIDLYHRLKQQLKRCSVMKLSLPAIGFGSRQGNSPVGKEVFLAGGSEQVGVITLTYDKISGKPLRFPMDIAHDLSLITNSAGLPEMISPNETPRVTGWGSYKDFLDGKPVFITGFNVTTGNLIRKSGTGLSRNAQVVLAEGAQYLWDRQTFSQNVSLLWRTEKEHDSLKGFSGSAVCLGELGDQTCQAVCFQNFESPLDSDEILRRDPHGIPTSETRVVIKGGFLLPANIRETEILCGPPDIPNLPGTYPRRSNATRELREVLSSIH